MEWYDEDDDDDDDADVFETAEDEGPACAECGEADCICLLPCESCGDECEVRLMASCDLCEAEVCCDCFDAMEVNAGIEAVICQDCADILRTMYAIDSRGICPEPSKN